MLVKIACLCVVVVSVVGAPTDSDKEQPTVIPIISQSEEVETNGTYKFSFETGNGIKREESSYDKVLPKVEGRSAGGEENNDTSDEIHVQTGSYSYTAPDGTLISVRYVADENGFQPIGDHIPSVSSPLSVSTKEKSGRALNPDSAEAASAPAVVAKASLNNDTKSLENSDAKISSSEEPNTVDSKNTASTITEEVTTAAKAESSETTESTEKTTKKAESELTTAAQEPASSTVSDKSTEATTPAEAPTTEASSTTT